MNSGPKIILEKMIYLEFPFGKKLINIAKLVMHVILP